MTTPQILFPCDAMLGEGVSWDAATARLWWVDILGKRLFRGDPATGVVEQWPQPTEIGAAIACADGRRALVLRDRVDLFDAETGTRTLLWQGDEAPSNRFNDAGTDRAGNLWITSMDFDAVAPTGALWRVTPAGEGRRLLTGYPCLNGPVFSPDNRTLYMGDTMAGRVLAFDHDPATGDLGDARPFIDLGGLAGLADGMAVDADGCLWLARVSSGRVTRYAPDGAPLMTIALPVPMVTSCAFGGTDNATLYMTTARIIMDETDLAAYPDSGSVYSVATTARGCALSPFAV